MRVRFGRPELIVLVLMTTSALVASASFGPLVRAKVVREAAKRHVDVTVGAVRPGWFAVRLLDLDVKPYGTSSIRAHVAAMRIGLSALARVEQIEVNGAEVVLTGSAESVRTDWRKWRSEPGREPTRNGGAAAVVNAVDVSIRWTVPGTPELGADLRGLAISRDVAGTQLSVRAGQLRLGRAGIDLHDAAAKTDSNGVLVRARAASLTVGWTGNAASALANADPVPAPSDAGRAPSPPVILGRTAAAGRQGRAPPPVDAGAPLVPLPELHAIRASAAALAGLLADHVKLQADLGVDSLTWSIRQRTDRLALTFGPGRFSLTRMSTQFQAAYSTDAHAASTPLSLRLLLPTDGGDLVLIVEGGPVSLALLGVKEGAAGLADVDRASVLGRARMVLAGDGSALTFDVDGGAHGMSVNHPKLALDVVRGIDVTLRARGAMTSTGEVRLDDFATTLGALRIAGSGILDQEPDHVSASARFEIPLATCQSLLDSIPTALLPTLHGTQIGGTFAARGQFAFDTRSLDDLELSYDTEDRCRVDQVPAALDHDRFTRPFVHRIYLPDGSTTEETTGPGTSNWTTLDEISPYMQTAVLTTEDGAFPKHHGYNHAAVRAAIIANLKARRFVRGASTITMQLAKNLFLSRDKTLSRKLEEVVLTDYLEQAFTKDELMELYLNVIEFGPAVYGITSAAEYYFARTPAELDLAECLFLSSLLPAPLRYGVMRSGEQPPDGWMRALHALMEVQRKRGLITDAELSEGEDEPILFWHGGPRPPPRPSIRARPPAGGNDQEIPDPFESPPE